MLSNSVRRDCVWSSCYLEETINCSIQFYCIISLYLIEIQKVVVAYMFEPGMCENYSLPLVILVVKSWSEKWKSNTHLTLHDAHTSDRYELCESNSYLSRFWNRWVSASHRTSDSQRYIQHKSECIWSIWMYTKCIDPFEHIEDSLYLSPCGTHTSLSPRHCFTITRTLSLGLCKWHANKIKDPRWEKLHT